MALKFGMPKTDDLRCSNPVCNDKAMCVLHLTNKTEVFFCQEHFPHDAVGQENAISLERLRRPGERNV